MEKISDKPSKGRKFAVVIMTVVLLAMGMVAGVIGAYQGVDLPWLGLVLPVLASVLPGYIAGNVFQKIWSKQSKDSGNGMA